MIGALESRVETLALSAVTPLSLIARVTTAVPTVPVATAVVVFVVTTVVTHKTCCAALFLSWTFIIADETFMISVQTLTPCAVFPLKLVIILSTAVTTIPITRAVIVSVIASFVTVILRTSALATTTLRGFVFRIFTEALRTVRKLIFAVRYPATIASVPVTSAVVILIVAVAILDPNRGATFTRTLTS